MSEYKVKTEAPGFYNDGDGYVHIRCLDNAMRSMKIIQHNCVLTNQQVLKVYGFVSKCKTAVYPRVCRCGGPNTDQTKDEFLSLYVYNAKKDQNEHYKLSDLPEFYDEKIAEALQKNGDKALQITKSKLQTSQLSAMEIKKLSDTIRPR